MERAAEKLAVQREKLSRIEPGGTPDHPIDVSTAAVVEPHARSLPCPRCGDGQARVDEHTAEEIDSQRRRVVRTTCPRCGARRATYFRIVQPN